MLRVNGLAPTTSSPVVTWLRVNGLMTATTMPVTIQMKMVSMSTGTRKINGKAQQFQSNGKWIGEIPVSRGFEKGKYTNTVFLDPGHGGKDPGAVYYNTNEKDLTMQVYQKLRKELEGLWLYRSFFERQ